MYRAHCSLVFVRRRILQPNFAMLFDYVKLCSMMGAIGEVVVGDLQALRFILEARGLSLDEESC